MTTPIYFDNQKLAVDGYRIEYRFKGHLITERDEVKRYVVPNLDNGECSYSPLDHPSLFRIFSDLSDDENDILDFANKYGLLFEPKRTAGESLYVWRPQIHILREAVNLWDNIQSNNESWLRDRIIWEGNDHPRDTEVLYKPDKAKLRSIASNIECGDQFSKIDYGDLIKPARLQLQIWLNEVAKNNFSYQFRFVEEGTMQSNYITAHDLLGFMWLQLAQAVEGNFEYRRCNVCNTPFKVATSERGKPRRFCSDACKAKDYRKNKKKRAENE